MSRTPFSDAEFSFTHRAHLLARSEFYPGLFGVPADQIGWWADDGRESVRSALRFMDTNLGIDRLAEVPCLPADLVGPVRFSIQERFRRPSQAFYADDITITANNPGSGLRGEMQKIIAEYFVYGAYDDAANELGRVVAVDCRRMKLLLTDGQLPFDVPNPNRRSGQRFYSIRVDDLRRTHCLLRDTGGFSLFGEALPA